MLKKIFSISCKRATFLASLKENGKTTFWQNIQLKIHYKICVGCNLFEKQTAFICKNAKALHMHTDVEMSTQKKNEIKKLMQAVKLLFTVIFPAV